MKECVFELARLTYKVGRLADSAVSVDQRQLSAYQGRRIALIRIDVSIQVVVVFP